MCCFFSVDGLFSALKDQAMQSAEPLSAFAATICAKRISAITSNKSGDDLLLSEDEKVLLIVLLLKQKRLFFLFISTFCGVLLMYLISRNILFLNSLCHHDIVF